MEEHSQSSDKLTAERVKNTVSACLYKEGEIVNGTPPDDAILVKGIVHMFGFHPQRIKEQTPAIIEMLSELHDNFDVKKGGGYSFLTMPARKDGSQWGEQSHADQLLCLGIAAGHARYALEDRELWSAFPGGVPYVIINLDADTATKPSETA